MLRMRLVYMCLFLVLKLNSLAFQTPGCRLMQLSIKGKVSTAVRKLIDSARSYETFNSKFAKPNQKLGAVQCLLIIDTSTFCHIAGFGNRDFPPHPTIRWLHWKGNNSSWRAGWKKTAGDFWKWWNLIKLSLLWSSIQVIANVYLTWFDFITRWRWKEKLRILLIFLLVTNGSHFFSSQEIPDFSNIAYIFPDFVPRLESINLYSSKWAYNNKKVTPPVTQQVLALLFCPRRGGGMPVLAMGRRYPHSDFSGTGYSYLTLLG